MLAQQWLEGCLQLSLLLPARLPQLVLEQARKGLRDWPESAEVKGIPIWPLSSEGARSTANAGTQHPFHSKVASV